MFFTICVGNSAKFTKSSVFFLGKLPLESVFSLMWTANANFDKNINWFIYLVYFHLHWCWAAQICSICLWGIQQRWPPWFTFENKCFFPHISALFKVPSSPCYQFLHSRLVLYSMGNFWLPTSHWQCHWPPPRHICYRQAALVQIPDLELGFSCSSWLI